MTMRWGLIAAVYGAMWVGAAVGDDAIPIKTLTEIKESTVFVKLTIGPVVGSGSGFVMMLDGQSALIATNEHVIALPKQIPRGMNS
jgi:S1-C subfamily serine protease